MEKTKVSSIRNPLIFTSIQFFVNRVLGYLLQYKLTYKIQVLR